MEKLEVWVGDGGFVWIITCQPEQLTQSGNPRKAMFDGPVGTTLQAALMTKPMRTELEQLESGVHCAGHNWSCSP